MFLCPFAHRVGMSLHGVLLSSISLKGSMQMETSNNPLTVARYLRSFRGLSMMGVADRLHLPFLTVLNLEHGRGSSLGTLRKAARFYGVSLDCLARNDMAAAATQLTSPAIRSNRTKTILREKQQRCDRVGDCGERIVIERERNRLAGTPYELAVNGNASEDLTAGFDVLSFTTEGVPIYIEVKTTVLGKDDDFFISRGELEFAQRCRERGLQYQLHRVYKLNEDTGDCSVVVFTADELLRSFELIPVSYKVRRCAV